MHFTEEMMKALMKLKERFGAGSAVLLTASVALSQSGPAKPTPQSVLAAFLAKCENAQSISADESEVLDLTGMPRLIHKAKIKARRPNCWIFENETLLDVSNGQKEVVIDKRSQRYRTEKSPEGLEGRSLGDLLPSRDIHFDSQNFEQFEGVVAVHASVVLEKAADHETVKEYWIDPVRLAPIASKLTTNFGGNRRKQVFRRFSHVDYDSPRTVASDFAIKIPAGVSRMTDSSSIIAVGANAPTFSVKAEDGSRLTLAEALKNHKAVILNFWFVECGVCRKEFPYMESLYQRLRNQGLEVYAIDQGYDSWKNVNKYFKDNKLSFHALVNDPNSSNDVVKAYEIHGYPTSYLVTPDGKIAAILVGYAGDSTTKEMEAELRKIGFSI